MAAMADHVTEHITIAARPDAVMAVLVDFDSYMEWARDLKEVTVLERDEQNRATSVRFRAAAMGRSTSYTLAYDYSDPTRLTWVLDEGDLTKKLDGYYELAPVGDGTEVTYQLHVAMALPIPGFIKRRGQGRIMHTALDALKERVESLAGRTEGAG